MLLQNLDITAGDRRLLHEGPLTWRIQHSKKTVGECERNVCVCMYVCMYTYTKLNPENATT